MLYEDLHRRYGTYIAKRVHAELKDSEFAAVRLDDLTHYLETRAEAAHRDYKLVLDNPLAKQMTGSTSDKIDSLYTHWHDAEDLAYLIAIAESIYGNLVTANAKA